MEYRAQNGGATWSCALGCAFDYLDCMESSASASSCKHQQDMCLLQCNGPVLKPFPSVVFF